MPEGKDDFERRLERDLRDWTDRAAREPNWTEEARALTTATLERPGRLRPFALTAAATLLAAAVGVFVLDLDPFSGEATGSASAQPSGTTQLPTPSAIPEPSTLPGDQLDLSSYAWWDEQSFGFGFIPEEPLPTPVAMPPSYKQVRIGTLDGRITAVLALSDQWSRSYVSGPVGTDVLVVNDDGATSTTSVVSALHGTVNARMVSSEAIVPAAVLSPTTDEIFYVRIDRETGIDHGLWRQSPSGDEAQILAGPLGEPLEDLSVWQAVTSLDGQTIIVQSCFGEVRCTSYFVDLASRAARHIDSISWPIGITDDELITRRANPGDTGLVAVDLVTLEIRPLLPTLPEAMPVRVGGRWLLAYGAGPEGLGPTTLLSLDDTRLSPVPGDGEDPSGSAIHSLVDRFGISLPDGWVIRGPDPSVGGPRDPNSADRTARQLINVATGERVTLDPFRWVIANDSCVPLAPAEMPDGQGVGPSVETLEDGLLYSTWGGGSSAVIEGVAYSGIDRSVAPNVIIRSLPGAAIEIGGRESQAALVWEEDGCPYTIWLPPGTSLDEAQEYAGRF